MTITMASGCFLSVRFAVCVSFFAVIGCAFFRVLTFGELFTGIAQQTNQHAC